MIVTLLSISLPSKNVLAETTVSNVRAWAGPEYTRLTLESNSPIQYSLIMLDNPGRVVIDLENVALTSALKSLPDKIKNTDPLVQTIRIGHFNSHVLRLVLDLKVKVVPRAFMLEPMNNFDHRLVFDIYPADKAAQIDPLDALVAELIEKDIAENLQNNEPEQLKSIQAAKKTKPLSSRMVIVAIDAGHGGKDPGATGSHGTHEKDITLSIAKKLKTEIDKEPNMRAVLTREGDYYMSLSKRLIKARRLNVDLFVSVHADAAKRKSAHGSSVYTLSEHGATSTAASWLAKKENSVDGDLMGGVDIGSKSTDIKGILIDLSLNATINDSVKLAKHVLGEIGNFNRLHKKQVEQAAFHVLKSPDIPSILVETAFLSNPNDEKKLKTKTYQNKMVKAMLAGIKRYFASGPALAREKMAQVE